MQKKLFRRIVSLAMALVMTMSLTVTGHAAENGITRGEMAQALVMAAGYAQEQVDEYAAKTSVFTDVAEGSAYEGAINLASAKGLVSGVGGGKFAPDAKATMREAAAVLLKMYDMSQYLNSWPADYDSMAKWSGLTEGVVYNETGHVTAEVLSQMLVNGMVMGDRPVIGISWKSNTQNYDSFKQVIYNAGGIPVEMPQIKSTAVKYGEDNMVQSKYLMASGNLESEYAEIVKSNDFSKSNVAEAVAFKDIDGMFFTGGEDISPSLYAVPQTEANEGEEINATRDISDYTLMAYCIEKDIPTFAVCRGQQMMSIVSGSGFVQDIPNYFEAKGAAYPDTHRMPVGAPNRTYARHEVDISKDSKWLYDIVGDTKLENVSSWHHQMAELPSENLTVVATTTVNGITTIEAVERQDKTFCLGVQFHPENDCVMALNGQVPPCDLETCQQFFETLVAYADDRPVIGISWMANNQDYEDYKYMIRMLGGIPVEMPQVKSTAVQYGEDNMILGEYLMASGNLETKYAEIVKSKDFTLSNVAEAAEFKGIDGMFFTGGEDISPSLYAVPQTEANEGEEINATRDISDYTLMAYCFAKDIPTFAVCRGQQMMSVVSGSSFIQDIPNYFESKGAAYPDTHRMPVGAPNRTYARHDVDILNNSKWLYNIVGNNVLENVSSWHHQAADMTGVEGTNLTVVAKKVVNGVEIIEGVERQDLTFCLGVQFHPENDVTCAVYWNEPSEVQCNLNTCMEFFRTLIDYASAA